MFGRHPRLIGDVLLNLTFNHPSHDNIDRFTRNSKKAYATSTQRLEDQKVKYKKFYDAKQCWDIQTLYVNDIVLVTNENVYHKIDNRWYPSPHIVLSQPNTDVPVFKVNNFAIQVIRI